MRTYGPAAVALIFALALLLGGGLTGCASSQSDASSHSSAYQWQGAGEQREFWNNLQSLCGQAFEGRVIEDSTASPDFARTPLIMHVRTCEDGHILVPFHVADDRSRTWVFTLVDGGLRLKHDHRHADGSEDEITQYGGDTRGAGSSTSQAFYADAHTAELLPAAATNIWTVELIADKTFTYSLQRVGTDRRFSVEFDLTRPVAAPPAPWGHQ